MTELNERGFDAGGVVPLATMRVLDLSRGIAGAYCSKLLADAGADVAKVEPEGGDPLRRWNDAGLDLEADGALFQYLCASKRSVIGELDDVALWAMDADVVVEDLGPDGFDRSVLLARHPGLVLVSISPFGLTGPWADRVATEFTLQALSGSMAGRGSPDRAPLHAGGRLGEWLSGGQAAVAGLAAFRRARRTGHGEHVDLSMLEVMIRLFGRAGLTERALGAPDKGRIMNVPSILPTLDGWVGTFLMTRQHFNDFVALIGHPDLQDSNMWQFVERFKRRAEFLALVHEWSTKQTTDEIMELFTSFEIPVVPIGDGANLPQFEQSVANGVFVTNPAGGFLQPRIPYTVSEARGRPLGAAPAMKERADVLTWESDRAPHSTVEPAAATATSQDPELPLTGVRVVDFTGYWAGPEAIDLLAALGADVIKVESPYRPDPERAMTARHDDEQWWEYAPGFVSTDRNRRGISVDLTTTDGHAVVARLVGTADVVIDNFRPGVLDRLGFSPAAVHALSPRAVVVKMPAFGLTGPWKAWGAFGPSIEQVSGLAFQTGYTPDEPLVPGGPCDPIAGVHAAFATLVALEARDITGTGNLVEVPMFEAGLNMAAEIVLEYSAYRRILQPRGNRGPSGAPQGVFACAGTDQWVAIAIETSDQWRQLRQLLALEDRLAGDDLLDVAARRYVEDEIEAHLAAWCAARGPDDACEILHLSGIPAERVISKQAVDTIVQLQARGFIETVNHSLLGELRQPGIGFRYASHHEQWLRRAAPTLGEHNTEVLTELGFSADEIARLVDDEVIGTTLLNRS